MCFIINNVLKNVYGCLSFYRLIIIQIELLNMVKFLLFADKNNEFLFVVIEKQYIFVAK